MVRHAPASIRTGAAEELADALLATIVGVLLEILPSTAPLGEAAADVSSALPPG